MQEGDPREPKNSHPERKEQRPLEGRRITPQLPCHPHTAKQRLKIQYHSKEPTETDTFRDMLSKRDRIKQSHGKQELKTNKRPPEQSCHERPHNKKSNSKSRSKSKGIIKSKSTKQLVKKSKSMIRLQPHKHQQKEERKSESPHNHGKSVLNYADRKQFKSNFNSKTNRQFVSELTTEREKSKTKLKPPKIFKKPKVEMIKKGTNKSTKAKSQKQNSKVQKKSRIAKPKKDKKVLVSQQNSKVRRDQQWENSLNEDQFLDPKGHDGKSKISKLKDSNIVDIPKRKERLSLNSSGVHRKVTLKNKTEVQIQSYRSRKRQIQNLAAITIQKVFRGYLTRKYIKQCFQYNAAINIQRIWRGYCARRLVKNMKKYASETQQRISPKKEIDNKTNKIFQQQDYLLQKSSERSDLKSSVLNQRWASILEEILEEQSVNLNIKRKIQNFLESQRKDLNQFDLDGSKSPSARSSISSQVINNQINSQRHFLAQERLKRQHPNGQLILHSPNPYFSPRRIQYGSPQPYLGSPKSRIDNQSPPRSSAQLLVTNLKNIQQLHVDRLKNKANTEKQQLNSMLIKNKLSPRTHQKKYKQVDLNLQCQLQKFNQSINQVVKNCIIYGEPDQIVSDTTMITPKKQLAQLQIPQSSSSPRHPQQPQQMSLQLRQYYEAQQKPHEDAPQPFDTSYQFIEQYLINLIEYIRQTENGQANVLSIIFKSKSHQIDTILRNLKAVTQASDQQQNQNSFRLPMYKYIDMDEEIISLEIIQSFNQTFPKVQHNTLGTRNIFQDNFIKMIADCMNQALNSLRPLSFPFTETRINTVNSIKSLQKISLFQYEGSEEEMHYQFIFAQALNRIFYWNKLQWGKVIRYDENAESFNQTKIYLMKLMDTSIVQLHSSEDWNFYQELIEILGNLTDWLFESIIFEEIATVWGTIIDWGQSLERSPMKIQPPNSKTFFQP